MYTLLKWNGKFGKGAKFVAKDNERNLYCVFAPAHSEDREWVKEDLSKKGKYSKWEDFENEMVEDIDMVIM